MLSLKSQVALVHYSLISLCSLTVANVSYFFQLSQCKQALSMENPT